MSKAVLINAKPNWCKLIDNGREFVEVRKTRPKLETPFKVYIYCAITGGAYWIGGNSIRGNGKIIGEFICDNIKPWLYAWHISDLKIYDKPRELSEFRLPEMAMGFRYEDDTIKRPPQSWRYVEEREQK